MWFVCGLLFLVWLILTLALHKSGFVHILLIACISVLGVQLLAYRKTQYHKPSHKR
jgi:hypothetical protein